MLDLDGDGIEVTKMGFGSGSSEVYFDLDSDGFAERTACLAKGSGDGFLVIDRNGNGVIDDAGEMFGANAQYATGFANLKSLDSNKNNKISALDTEFSKLRVWIDADGGGDGFVQVAFLYNVTGLTDEKALETSGVFVV